MAEYCGSRKPESRVVFETLSSCHFVLFVVNQQGGIQSMDEKSAARPPDCILASNEKILITGSNGFIGSRVVEALLSGGFTNLRCFVRPSSTTTALARILAAHPQANIEVVSGNLLSREDCATAARGVAVVYHLAAGIEKTFAGSFLNSVVATRNLLDALIADGSLQLFVNISSFAVYSNRKIKRGGLLDESCPVEDHLVERHEPYTYAKLKQDEFVMEYAKKHGLPYVILRPGAVYGPGKKGLTARVGIDTFGVFLHLGGTNTMPLTYVDNCAQAIVLAGIKKGVEGEVFNIVDDDLPTSRALLTSYQKNVGKFFSLRLPYPLFYCLCVLWEKYAKWSRGQLSPSVQSLEVLRLLERQCLHQS
jgi:nucleoside-diphosphate-sugar epimerase